jgi:hypothetical protein
MHRANGNPKTFVTGTRKIRALKPQPINGRERLASAWPHEKNGAVISETRNASRTSFSQKKSDTQNILNAGDFFNALEDLRLGRLRDLRTQMFVSVLVIVRGNSHQRGKHFFYVDDHI